MKKAMILFLSLTLAVSLSACGGNPDRQQESSVASTKPAEDSLAESESEETEASSETEEGTGLGRALVVYYSASGNTKEAAEYIASVVNGDIFEIVPSDPYSDADLDWTDDDNRVAYEHDNPDARDVALAETAVFDWESYETVFIGYAGGIIGLN